MSEKEPIKLEQDKLEASVENQNVNIEKPTADLNSEKELSNKKAEIARANIDDIAKSREDVPIAGDLSGDNKEENLHWTSKELLAQTYDRSLTSIRNRLNKPQKTFSKTIHNSAVEKTSEVVGSTIARPSGILFGSIFSFLGSLGGYIVARRLGGELPYSIFAFLFVGGYAFGLLLELLIAFHKKRKIK